MRTASYLAEHYGNLYDFFFIVRDDTYVRGYRLKELTEDLSVSTDVLLGARDGDSCKLGKYKRKVGGSIPDRACFCWSCFSQRLRISVCSILVNLEEEFYRAYFHFSYSAK